MSTYAAWWSSTTLYARTEKAIAFFHMYFIDSSSKTSKIYFSSFDKLVSVTDAKFNKAAGHQKPKSLES